MCLPIELSIKGQFGPGNNDLHDVYSDPIVTESKILTSPPALSQCHGARGAWLIGCVMNIHIVAIVCSNLV